jgi:hypothetical protein
MMCFEVEMTAQKGKIFARFPSWAKPVPGLAGFLSDS